MQQFGSLFYTISIWALPAIIAITFHEAAHGFAAHRFGDDTAWQLGRVTLNPLKHIDPTGTILLPGLLLLLHSPFRSRSTSAHCAIPGATWCSSRQQVRA
jgi:Zn-dependent protease